MKKKNFLAIIKWVWFLAVLLAAGYYFYRHRLEVGQLVRQISLIRIFFSLLLLLLGKSLIVLLASFSVNAEAWTPKFLKMLGLYGVTSLGKYIPGGVWHFVGRIGAYRANGLTAKKAARALVLETVWLISSAVFVGAAAMLIFRFDLVCQLLKIPSHTWLSIVFLVVLFLAWIIVLAVLHHYYAKYTENHIKTLWIIVPVSITLWTLIGLSFFVIFPGFSIDQAGVFIGGYALSWAVGYVAVFAPGGIGVREAVLALVFSSIVSVEMIAVYAAMNRIIWVVAEVLFGLVGIIQKQELLPIPLEEAEDLDWGSNSGKIPDLSTLADDPDADVLEEQNHSAI